jgi:hypothetical protein
MGDHRVEDKAVEIVGLGSESGHAFDLYFSDGTVARVTGAELAERFPERKPVGASRGGKSTIGVEEA